MDRSWRRILAALLLALAVLHVTIGQLASQQQPIIQIDRYIDGVSAAAQERGGQRNLGQRLQQAPSER
jgi:hypothetical protein